MCSRLLLTAWACCFLGSSVAFGQGLLLEETHRRRLPRPIPTPGVESMSYKIESIDVQAQLRDQVAQVQVSQTFVNTGQQTMQVQFVFPLPYDAAIDQLTLLVNGKEYPAKLLPKDEARSKYEAIVRASKDPALLEWMGNGMFQTSVFPIPPGEKRTVTLNYNQLLRKFGGVTDFLFPLNPARYTSKPIEKLTLSININSTLPIKNVYSPSNEIIVDKQKKNRAKVSFKMENAIPTSDFRMLFDVNEKKVGASLLSYRPNKDEDGYFLMLATPQIPDSAEDKEIPKTVSVVIDKSGSMSGQKIEQAKEAAKFVVNHLNDEDIFNVISYNSSVTSFRPELETFTSETRAEALGFISDIQAGGSTNIHDSLTMAIEQLTDPHRPSYVIFLTDGLPTAGETNELKIAQAAKRANKYNARLLNFGVGYDVNSRLLDRLATENRGASEYVRPNENIETAVSRLYRRISDPALTDVKLAFKKKGHDKSKGSIVNRLYPGGEFDLFSGEQAVFVGRYKATGKVEVTLKGNVGDQKEKYSFDGEFAAHSHDQTFAFIEKLWAVRRVGEIIDELDLNGKNAELTKELVALATKHGIITPYTSFLADENSRPTLALESFEFETNTAVVGESLRELEEVSGLDGTAQRAIKQQFKNSNVASGQAPAAANEPQDAAAAFGGTVRYRDSKTDKVVSTSNVLQRGNYSLYRRGGVLCTTETADLFSNEDGLKLKLDELGDKVKVVERFTDEYFTLCRQNSASENELLAKQRDDEQLLVQLRGQAYLIK